MASNVMEAIIALKDQFTGNAKKIDKSVKSMGTNMGKLQKQVIGLAAGYVTLRAGLAFVKDSVSLYTEFEDAMRNANSMLLLNQKGFDVLSEKVLKLSKQVPLSAKELADGLFLVVSAGVSAENQMAFLTVGAQFAVAAHTDLTTAIGGLVSVIKNYNLAESDAVRVAGMFAMANKTGITTIGDMAIAMQKVAGNASALGLSVEQVMAVFGTFTGITGNANEVATQLNAALKSLVGVTPEVRQKIDSYNKAHADSVIVLGKHTFAGKNFAEVARQIWEAVGKDFEVLKLLIPEMNAAKLVMVAATSQFDKFNTVLGNMDEDKAAEAFFEMFEEQMKSQKNQLKVMEGKYQFFQIKFGEIFVPMIIWVMEWAEIVGTSMKIVGTYLKNGFQSVYLLTKLYVKKVDDAIGIIAQMLGTGLAVMWSGLVLGIKKSGNEIIKWSNKIISLIPFADDDVIKFRFDTTQAESDLSDLASFYGGLEDDLGKGLLEYGTEADIAALIAIETSTQSLGAEVEKVGQMVAGVGEEFQEWEKFKNIQNQLADLTEDNTDKTNAFGNANKEAAAEAEKAAKAAKAAAEESIKALKKEIVEREKLAEATRQYVRDLESAEEQIKKENLAYLKSTVDKQASFKERVADMAYGHKKRVDELNSELAVLKEQKKEIEKQKQALGLGTKYTIESRVDIQDQLDEIKKQEDELAKKESLVRSERQKEVSEMEKGTQFFGKSTDGNLSSDLMALASRTEMDRMIESYRRDQGESTVAHGTKMEELAAEKKSITINFDFKNATVSNMSQIITDVLTAMNREGQLSELGALGT